MAADVFGPGALTVPQYQLSALEGVAPAGWEPAIKRMKKSKEVSNPFALAWYMKKRGMQPAKHESKADSDFDVAYAQGVAEVTAAGMPDCCVRASHGESVAWGQCMGTPDTWTPAQPGRVR